MRFFSRLFGKHRIKEYINNDNQDYKPLIIDTSMVDVLKVRSVSGKSNSSNQCWQCGSPTYLVSANIAISHKHNRVMVDDEFAHCTECGANFHSREQIDAFSHRVAEITDNNI